MLITLQYPFVRLFEVVEGKRSFCTNLKMSVTLQRVIVGVIHLVRTHKGGGGSCKSVRHAYKGGGGLTHGSTYTKASLFCTCFVIFSCAGSFYHTSLSLAWNFITFYKTFAMIIFLSFKSFSVYFSMELFIGYLKTSH